MAKIKVVLFGLLAVIFSNKFALGYQVLINSVTKNFEYRREIIIQGSRVQGGPHDNFPMYFTSMVDSGLQEDLQYEFFSPGKVKNNNGYDIVFAEGDGQEILKHEIEEYGISTGQYLAWVKVDLTGSNQTIYIYYGSSDVSSDTQHKNETWNTEYKGVWHLKETAGSTRNDSTSNGNHLTDVNSVGRGPGRMGFGATFDASSSQKLYRTDDGGLDPSGNLTFSAWVYCVYTVSPDTQSAIDKDNGATRGYRLRCNSNTYFETTVWDSSGVNGGGRTNTQYSSWVWYYVVGVYNGSTVRNYVNGDFENQYGHTTGIGDSPNSFQLGARGNGQYLSGRLDEVRISFTDRSGDWIKTEFNNMNAASSFYQVGSQQTLVELSYFRATSLDSAVVLEWATETELDNAGFNIWRSEEKDGDYARKNPYFIFAEGEAGFGAKYRYVDYDVQNEMIYYYKLEDIDIYGKSAFHGPVPAVPNDIVPIWPPDRIIRPSDALVFSWSSSGSFSFKVEISPNPSFSSSETLSFPEEEWTSDFSLWFTPREWEMILRKAQQSGGQLFWRIRARGQNGKEVCSGSRRFIIDH